MKVTVKALEVYTDGKLSEVKVLGDEDSGDSEVCVNYELTGDFAADIKELKEVMKGWAQATRTHHLGQAIDNGNVLIQMEANYLPRKIGRTTVEMKTKEVDW